MMAARTATHVTGLSLALGLAILWTAEKAVADPGWTLTLRNETGQTLTFYDVNPNPPPARPPAGTVSNNGTFSIDLEGFNTVFAWDGGVSMTGTDPNGFFLGFDFSTDPG